MAGGEKAPGQKFSQDDNPATPGTVAKRQQPALKVVRDVYGGTLHLRSLKAEYLPQWPKEESTAYERRVQSAYLFNALKRTNKGLVGMIFRKDPVLGKELSDALRADLDDVDLQGHDLATFARNHMEDAELDGHAAIFVDMLPPVETAESKADEAAAGNRPYWVSIRKGDILRFDLARIGGTIMLTHIAWLERTIERKGRFKDEEVTRVRELTLAEVRGGEDEEPRLAVIWTLWEQRKDDKGGEDQWFVASEGELNGIARIPVAVTYTGYVGPLESEPPLEDLAHLNLAHYRKQSDLDNVEHVACVPILSLSGVEDEVDNVAVGAAIGLKFSSPQGKAAYTEVTGEGMAQVRQSLDKLEQNMAILGLSMLMSETRQAETATSKRIDKSESDSQLASAARSLENALNLGLQFHAEWKAVELPAEEAGVTVNRDFENLQLDPQLLQAVADLVPSKLSLETLWKIMQQGEILPDDFDADTERERLETADVETLQRFLRATRGQPEKEGEGAAA